MNENINLSEILKDCPKGTILWCLAMGTVVLTEVSTSDDFPIVVKSEDNHYHYFTKKGTLCKSEDASCILFPSKDQRDWSKWQYHKPKFDPNTLNPYDKIIVRDNSVESWSAALFSHISFDLSEYDLDDCEEKLDFIICTTGSADFSYCVPYNEETKHLVGTSDEAPEYYRYWED